MKNLILTLWTLLVTISSYSQHQTISVNGIELDKKYTQSHIYNILGTPKSIITEEDDSWCSWYDYNNSSFCFKADDWVLLDFLVKDPISKINNYLTVGMYSDSINAMKGYLTYGSIDDKTIHMYWAPSKEYRDKVGYIRIYINKQTKIIRKISLQSQEMLCFY